jgi:ribonuclease P protein component
MAATPPARLRFPRSSRIKQKRDFTRTKLQGQRVISGCLIANFLPRPPGLPGRLGVITSRKVGQAVERSRARRLLRESFRLHQHEFERPVDLVLVARQSIVGKKFADVEKDFLRALRQGRLLKPSE